MTEKYDYSEYGGWENHGWTDDMRKQEFWGIHEVDNRIEIDVKRFRFACEIAGEPEYFPKKIGDTDYYIATKKNRYDYTSNYLTDSLNNLQNDWDNEYKPLFNSILSPKEAGDNYRTTTMAMFGNSDTFDSIELGSRWAEFERSKSYGRIITELHCVFITKVITEINRILLTALSMDKYDNTDFSVRDFVTYCNAKNKVSPETLTNWDVYSKFNNVNNFLKHNSRKAYDILNKFNPECVRENGDLEYTNGMFSYPWINMKELDIDRFLIDIREFLMDFCEKVLGEDLERSEWDYDGYFIDTYHELMDPMEHLEIYGACGMSPWD